MSLKNPVTPPGIDPGTIRLVAQRLKKKWKKQEFIFNKLQTLFGSIKYMMWLKESLCPQNMKPM